MRIITFTTRNSEEFDKVLTDFYEAPPKGHFVQDVHIFHVPITTTFNIWYCVTVIYGEIPTT